jgi:hypothetical protein
MADTEYVFDEGRATGGGSGNMNYWLVREEIVENRFVALQMRAQIDGKTIPYVVIPGYAGTPVRKDCGMMVGVKHITDLQEQKRIIGIARQHGFEGPVSFWNDKAGSGIMTLDQLLKEE